MPRTLLTIAASLLLAAAPAAAQDVPSSLTLAESDPDPGQHLEHVSEVDLWFDEVPRDGSVSVRVVDVAGQSLPVEAVTQDGDDGTHFIVQLDDPLRHNTYRLSWEALDQEGRPAAGELSFTVTESPGTR